MGGPNYAIAEFAFSKPLRGKPRAIVLMVPGSNSDGRYEINSFKWKEFAKKHNLVLCGCYFADFDPGTEEDYCKVSLGSGQALLDALEKAGYGDVPLLMWGFSAGGQFNYEFACWRPERVMGFVVNKGGIYFTGLARPETRRVPGLFFLGTADSSYRKYMVAGLYFMNMACGGCEWQLIQEPCEHRIWDSERKSLDFFQELLTGR